MTGPTPTPYETPPTTPAPSPPSAPAAPGPHRPSGAINRGPIEYKGEPLEAERGPGLGCFRFQLVVLVILIVATPLSVGRMPDVVTATLLFVTIGLLLVSGQTIIFLLRLVAAERRGRRQPLASRSPTVGQLEDASASTSTPDESGPGEPAAGPDPDEPAAGPDPDEPAAGPDPDERVDPDRPSDPEADPPATGPVRQ